MRFVSDSDDYSVRSAPDTMKGLGEVRRSPHTVVGRQQWSGRETLATLIATCLEDGATCTGAHALTKAVHLGTTTVVRLESPLDHGSTPTVAGRGSPSRMNCARCAHVTKRLYAKTPRWVNEKSPFGDTSLIALSARFHSRKVRVIRIHICEF